MMIPMYKIVAWTCGFALLLAAAGGWHVLSRYRSDLEIAARRITNTSSVAQTRCGPIEYAEQGSGTPVLVVHGAGGGFDQGLAFASDLARAGHRVIAMSRFGYLRTPLPSDASSGAQADAHACLLDALGIRTAAIIGASAGASSALQFALRHPDRCAALVLLVPAAYVPRPEGAPSLRTPQATRILFDTVLRSDFLFWLGLKLARSTMTGAILATRPEVLAGAAPDEQARANRMLDGILPVSRRRLGLLNDAAVTSSLGREPLESVAAPTLVISLDDDQFGTMDGARYAAEHIPEARFVGFEQGGHVWVGHHREIMDLVKQHLAGASWGGQVGTRGLQASHPSADKFLAK
jgi:2-hydroxy-6-oxonona-2,4-dienedioate hydrolase